MKWGSLRLPVLSPRGITASEKHFDLHRGRRYTVTQNCIWFCTTHKFNFCGPSLTPSTILSVSCCVQVVTPERGNHWNFNVSSIRGLFFSYLCSSKTAFLSFGTIGTWGRVVHCCEELVCTAHPLLDSSGILSSFPELWQAKMSLDIATCPLGYKLILCWEALFKNMLAQSIQQHETRLCLNLDLGWCSCKPAGSLQGLKQIPERTKKYHFCIWV